MGRLFILIGLLIAAAGLLMTLGFPIGRLPGDFSIRRGNFSFYFPLTTCLLISALISLILFLWNRK